MYVVSGEGRNGSRPGKRTRIGRRGRKRETRRNGIEKIQEVRTANKELIVFTMIEASSFVDPSKHANTPHTKRVKTRRSEDSRRKPQTGERVEEGRVSVTRFWYAPTPAVGKKEPGKKKRTKQNSPAMSST